MSEFPRPLTEAEQSVLRLLLSIDFPGVDEYRDQVHSAVVTARCPCGCLEFTILVPDGLPSAAGPGRVSGWSEEQQVHLELETHAGRLVGVRLVWFGADEFRLAPDLSTFDVSVLTAPE